MLTSGGDTTHIQVLARCLCGSDDGFGYANDELSGNSIHYPPTQDWHSVYLQQLFRGFSGPLVRLGKWSLAGAS